MTSINRLIDDYLTEQGQHESGASVVTFRVSRRQREMYSGHGRLYVCLCASVPRRMPTLLHGPGCNLGEW